MSTPSLEKPRHPRRRRRAETGSGAAENIIIILVVAVVGLVAVRQLGAVLGGRYTETAKCVAEMTTTNGECRPKTTGDLPDLPDLPASRFAAAAPASGAGPKPASGPAPEPTVCETEFEGGNCRKVSCPGGVLPDPGTFDSPCCGPGFAMISLTRSEGGERTAECCPSTLNCDLVPTPPIGIQCEPNNILCRPPGPRRDCGPLRNLVRFSSPAGSDRLLCCEPGRACQPPRR